MVEGEPSRCFARDRVRTIRPSPAGGALAAYAADVIGVLEAAEQAARAGIGVSLQSRVAVELEVESGRLDATRLRERLPVRRWFAHRSMGDPLRPPVEAFMEFVSAGEAQRVAEASRAIAP